MGKAVWGMVKRIVLWKIKDDENKQANLNQLREGLLSLNNKVNDMISLEVGLNYSASELENLISIGK